MIPCCKIDCREWKVDYTRSQHILDGATALPRYSHEESINNQYWRGVRRRSPRPARVTTDRQAVAARSAMCTESRQLPADLFDYRRQLTGAGHYSAAKALTGGGT